MLKTSPKNEDPHLWYVMMMIYFAPDAVNVVVCVGMRTELLVTALYANPV